VVVQVALVAGERRVPRAVEVVALDVAVVEVLEDLRVVPAAGGDVLGVRGQERGQEVVLAGLRAVRVELLAELLEEELEVARVVLDVDVVADLTAVRAGPLPVDVDAVEHAGRRTGAATAVDHGQVALDVDVDGRPPELYERGLRRCC